MGRNEVISRLTSDGAMYRCQGIINAAKSNLAYDDVIEALRRLKKDRVLVLGREVSWYATAALDAMGVEKYTGEDQELLRFISGFPALMNAV